jgi:hypothetical protein
LLQKVLVVCSPPLNVLFVLFDCHLSSGIFYSYTASDERALVRLHMALVSVTFADAEN